MLSPDDRLLIQVLMALGVGQLAILLRLMLQVGRVQAINESLAARLSQLEQEVRK